MRKKFRQFFIVLLVLLAVLAVAGLAYRSSGHRALEKYVGELRGKGEKLTLRELSATLSTNVSDSESVLTNVAGKLGPAPRTLDDLAATVLLPYSYSESGRVRVAWKLEVPGFSVSPKGGTAGSWTNLSNAVAAIDASLEELRQAMKQPGANTGPRANKIVPVPPDTSKNAAAWLATAALTELHFGRRVEAFADIQAFAGLAALNREEYDPTNQITRLELIHAGVELTWQALQTDWTDDQLQALQRSWQNVDAFDTLERCAVGERAESLELLARISERPSASYANASASQFVTLTLNRANRVLLVETLMDRDLLFRLHYTQDQVAMARLLQSNKPWKEVAIGFEQLEAELERREHAPQRWFYSLSIDSLPDLKPVFQQGVHSETERRLAVCAIALKRYKLKHNRVPPSLESLGADYLPVVPHDCMNALPLRYQANADGTFSLYSVGVDGRDNGGDPSPASSGGKPGLWEGRDTVWPWPAK
jgi:hypothetical protein